MQSAISQDEGLVADKKPTPIIRDADQLFRRGIDALEHDRFEEAAGLLQQAVGQDSQLPMAWLGLGIALGRLLRIPEATAALENAIALDPEAFYPHFRMAELHMRVGLIAQAEEELTRAMDLSTNDYERRLVRELRAVDRKRAPRRIWRPDFSGLFGGKPKVMTMTKERHIVLTLGTGALAAAAAIAVFGAPPIPVAAGVLITVLWLIKRGPVV